MSGNSHIANNMIDIKDKELYFDAQSQTSIQGSMLKLGNDKNEDKDKDKKHPNDNDNIKNQN